MGRPEALSVLLVGRKCLGTRRVGRVWRFLLDADLCLTVRCAWRLRDPVGLCTSGENDAQWFGLDEPKDAADIVADRMSGLHVQAVEVRAPCNDITLFLEKGLALDIWNSSCGAEAWALDRGGEPIVVCQTGGNLEWRNRGGSSRP